jgi:predicted transcriptional regulator
MFTPEVIVAIQTHLADGMSNATVAKKVGVSVSTVKRIRKGYLPGKKIQDRRIEKKECDKQLNDDLPSPINPDSRAFISNEDAKLSFTRCPGCGGMVQEGVSCLLCRVKKAKVADFDCYMNELLAVNVNAYPVSMNQQHRGC